MNNAYLELLGLHDEAEVRSPLVAPLGLWERLHWQQTGACSFGISLRPKAGTPETLSSETWSYAAPFLPSGATLPIFTPPGAVELPLFFLSPVAVIPAQSPARPDLPLEHLGDRCILEQVSLQLPTATALHKIPSLLNHLAQVQIALAESLKNPFHLELVWQSSTAPIAHTFSPDLPLSIRG
ncbi:hypothetical protein [Leptolyngbya sp. O-77]|uniref:hypothetical protein n=1 Tax=Leptolyngbya sp. O-77 TaxID=1080068 RepID=UPI00074D417C|nr:hypothetical protein [Leptolyngbya sp. O-77]BAU41612.1 hypothetical protein O77CONTIG1_01424 [Leptolyngbya sp. O-77]